MRLAPVPGNRRTPRSRRRAARASMPAVVAGAVDDRGAGDDAGRRRSGPAPCCSAASLADAVGGLRPGRGGLVGGPGLVPAVDRRRAHVHEPGAGLERARAGGGAVGVRAVQLVAASPGRRRPGGTRAGSPCGRPPQAAWSSRSPWTISTRPRATAAARPAARQRSDRTRARTGSSPRPERAHQGARR